MDGLSRRSFAASGVTQIPHRLGVSLYWYIPAARTANPEP
jgi:hypothetical protein